MSVGGQAASRSAGLLPRLLTALALMPLALGSVILGGRLYAAVIAAMTIFLLFEWTRMVDGAEMRRGFYVLSATAALAAFLAAGGQPLAAIAAALLGGALATGLEWPKPNPHSWPAVGAVYIIVPSVAALWLRRDAPDGAFLTLLLFVAVWAADSAAYFVGRSIGGPKLVPRISPNKTWSGAVGAVVGGGLAGMGLALVLGRGGLGEVFLLGLVAGTAAVLGDVTESYFKRRYGVKDSGGAFPGHGGVLDRLDGFLFAVLALAGIALLMQGTAR